MSMSVAIRFRRRLLPLWSAILVAGAGPALPAAAQTEPPRPVTGRHAPPRAGVSADDQSGEAGPWSVAIGAGLLASGDLFRASVPDGSARIWSPPLGGTFSAHEILVTLDEDLAVSAAVGRRLGGRWRVRCDLSWAEASATAEARVGQTVELRTWEKPTFLLAGLDVECQLLRARLYPYALAGVTVTHLAAAQASALDQTRVGLRGGVGLQLGFAPEWGLRAELRDTWQQFDLTDYGDDPAFADRTFEELGPQHLFELLLQVRALF
jgi:hypothetical protein